MAKQAGAVTVTAGEVGIIRGFADEAAERLAELEPDGDAHTSALAVTQWLEQLHHAVARLAERQTPGQLRMPLEDDLARRAGY